MIRVIEDLPDTVQVDGVEYPIYTDFRHWMAFEQMLFDPDLEDPQRLPQMLSWYKELPPPDLGAAIGRIIWFYRGGDDRESVEGGGGPGKAVYDFEEDAEIIFASFASAQGYGLDLAATEYLHWWKFRAMLLHISPKTAIGQVMGLRAANDADLTESQRKIKRLYELGRLANLAPKTLAERDRALMDKAHGARARSAER